MYGNQKKVNDILCVYNIIQNF